MTNVVLNACLALHTAIVALLGIVVAQLRAEERRRRRAAARRRRSARHR